MIFPSDRGLPVRIKIYVPATQGLASRISKRRHEQRAKIIANKLIRLFGGTTRISGYGSWSYDHSIIREPVYLVESFCSEEKWKRHANEMKLYLYAKKREWQQDTLSMEWEHLSKDLPYEGMHFL